MPAEVTTERSGSSWAWACSSAWSRRVTASSRCSSSTMVARWRERSPLKPTSASPARPTATAASVAATARQVGSRAPRGHACGHGQSGVGASRRARSRPRPRRAPSRASASRRRGGGSAGSSALGSIAASSAYSRQSTALVALEIEAGILEAGMIDLLQDPLEQSVLALAHSRSSRSAREGGAQLLHRAAECGS